MKVFLQKCLVLIKKKFSNAKIRNCVVYCIKKLFFLFSTLVKGFIFLFKNPQSIGVLAFFVFVSLLCYNIFSDQIFVEDVEIQGEAKDHGFTGASLTEQAVTLMPETANKRLDGLPTNEPFLQMIKRHSDNYETEQTCNFSVPLVPPDYAMLTTGIDRVEMSSKTPDQVITSQTVSIKKLAYWIRKKFNLGEIRQLRPILWKQNDKYILKINPTPNEVSNQQLAFDNLDDAPEKLATILLNYTAPEIYATELLNFGFTNEENFIFPTKVAQKFLSNKQKELLILNAWSASQLDFSKTHAAIKFKYKYFEQINRKLLDELDFNLFGQYAVIMKAIITNRLLRANCYTNCPNEIVDKYTGHYREELEQSVSGLLVLLFIDSSRSDNSYFYAAIDKLLKKDLKQETDGLFSNIEIALVISSNLLQLGKYQEALKILKTPFPRTLNIELEPKATVFALRSMKAALKALLGDITEYKQIHSENFGQTPCAEWMVTSALSHAIYKRGKHHINVSGTQLAELGNDLIKSHEQLERNGIKSHDFYNEWGVLENDMGHYQKAYDKYKQALRFEGDQTWVLLNWGNAALNNGELDLAREKFLQSLQLGVIPAAVGGFLKTLLQQGDKKAYVENFEKYSETLFAFEHPARSDFERAAIVFYCDLGAKATKTVLFPNEGIIFEGKTIPRDQFQKMACPSSAVH